MPCLAYNHFLQKKARINNQLKMKKIHQYLGLLMLLPFLAWAVTGVFFFVKPGYKQAYEKLSIQTYSLAQLPEVATEPGWQEMRWVRSILGLHLLVRESDKWHHIDPQTMQVNDTPTMRQVRRLVDDAVQMNPQRYGNIQTIEDLKVTMDTGVVINLNWSQLKFYQKGPDTHFINRMYKIHYLQWTGIETIDRVLGIIGLTVVVILALLGTLMTFRRRVKNQ
ncbi:PepSY domain-containing protein [Aliikangiella coralliicola]|uniref:PepSY domain-containing protein n=1 Tax=Aliikangiella coralliicola TaxID=2592383 RepID=A0A545UCV1_9GAMM|nr:PepSY domain-containing protein [Aliikangiella coralliicola]TQV87290.1 hypothetical protein FLL46_12630 [Aliikangiella coralliicola]